MAWKRDALAGALAGLAAVALFVGTAWAFHRLDSPPPVLLAGAAMVPGITVGILALGAAVWATTYSPPMWVMWVGFALGNTAVYSVTWVVLRSSGPIAKALKVVLVTLWVLWLAIAAMGGLENLHPFDD